MLMPKGNVYNENKTEKVLLYKIEKRAEREKSDKKVHQGKIKNVA
jgi:hypothetical protein